MNSDLFTSRDPDFLFLCFVLGCLVIVVACVWAEWWANRRAKR